MRKKGIIILFVFILLVGALFYFLTDRWLERQIELVGSSIVGAKVELDGLDLSLLQLRARWQRLQITDPNDTWRNLVETGRAEFHIAPEPLFYGRWIIEQLRLEDLRSGTKRSTDGKLPPRKTKKSDEPSVFDRAAATLSRELGETTGFDFSQLQKKINVDSLIKMLQLRTPGQLDTFRMDIQTTATHWEGEVKSLSTLKTEASDIVDQLQTIQVDQLKSLDEITRAITTIQSVRQQVDSAQQAFQNKKKAFVEDFSRLETQANSVDDWVREDIQRAAAKAHLPDFSTKNIARLLFGPKLVSRVQSGLRYFNLAQHYAAKMAPTKKVESPPRFKGQDIPFPDRRNWPKFWIKEMVVSGETGSSPEARGIILSGSAHHITSDQKIIGQPTVVKLSGEQINRTAYNLVATLNFLGEVPREDFQLAISRISLNHAKLGGSRFLPEEIERGSMDIQFSLGLEKENLDGKLDIRSTGISFRFDQPSPTDQFVRITQDVLRPVDRIDLNLRFYGEPEHLKIDLNSNLDDLFAARFQTLVSDQIARGRAEIESRIRSELEPRKQQVLQLFQQKRQELETRISNLEGQLNEKIQLVEARKKELEQKLEDEKRKQTEELKKKAKEKLEGILKKP